MQTNNTTNKKNKQETEHACTTTSAEQARTLDTLQQKPPQNTMEHPPQPQ